MKIEQDGTVVVRPEDASTFRDPRFPLMARFELLAVLLGSEEGLPRWGYEAERLVREVLVRYQGLANAAGGRQHMLDGLTNWNNSLRAENSRLGAELHSALWEIEELTRRSNG